jgi:hypothetical protein
MEQQEENKSLWEIFAENRRKHFVLDPDLDKRPIKFSEGYLKRQEAIKERMRNVKFPFPIGKII